jgi:hypothetical protein
VTPSDAIAVGALIVRNDVRSTVDAFIDNADVDAAGTVTVSASETATIRATTDSSVESDGGSIFGGGTSLAVNGVIASNAVLSSAEATIVDSDITTTAGGDVDVTADNASIIAAEVTSSTKAFGPAVGVTLAFNAIGMDTQNFLFDTVDALLGTSIGDRDPAVVQARIANSDVDADGDVTVTATSETAISANVETAAFSLVMNVGDDDGSTKAVSVGAVIAMNRLATDVQASIDGGDAVVAGGSIDVDATDESIIAADVNAPSMSVAISGNAATSVSVGLSIARNEIHNGMQAFLRDVGAVTAEAGSVNVTAHQSATIDATSSASSIAVAVSARAARRSAAVAPSP